MRYFFILITSIFFIYPSLAQDKVISIYFGGGSYYVDPVQTDDLHNFINAIPDINACEIEIHSHTDDIGSIEYNDWLSRARSQEIFQILQQNENLREEQILIMDFGETNPVFDNNTWEGKLRNRRVDIIVKKIAT